MRRVRNNFVAGDHVKPSWVRRGREWVRRSLELAARIEPIRRVLFELQHKISTHRYPVHPFDGQYGITTSGFLPGSVLRSGYSVTETTSNVGYLGGQPSIIRWSLSVCPIHNDAIFLDLGCGKGRALVVASEFPFRSVIGVEISPELAKLAEENAQVIGRNFPERTPITVVNGDALDYALPEGNLIIYLYNPFGQELIIRLLTNIETALLKRDSSIWVVYTNPVWGHILDRSSTLNRVYAESVPYDPAEIGFGPDPSELVIIWQGAKNALVNASGGLDREIVVINGQRAEFAD